ncbi:TetR-like C-terminal domain-containing protein [Streptomyces sp. NPDC002514]|uniref:TetR-like C-terminal domain-containing protein n=1 Tax=Streptomyces sp. NPDC001270 TaxID=3364554 RepID=UPI0036BA2C36
MSAVRRYRRWRTGPARSTGEIRRDLTTQLHAFVDLLRGRGSVVAEIIGIAQSDPDVAEALSTHYVLQRRRLAVERLGHAQQQAQIREDVDLESIVDQLWGACYHRLLLPAKPLTREFADQLIANLFQSITPHP